MLTIRTVAGAATAITAVLVLSACGSGGTPTGTDTTAAAPTPPAPAAPSTPAVASAHNQADVAFVHGMIPHHSQAVAMAEQAPTQAGNAQVKALAARIEQA